MITKLKIESFKSIENIEMDLGALNVIIGANGSGKSNLLEAVALLSAAAGGKVDQSLLMWRGCRPGSYFRPMFNDSPPDAPARISADDEELNYTVELSSPDQGRLGPWQYQKEFLNDGKKRIVNRRVANGASNRDPEAGLAALRLAEIAPTAKVSVFLKRLAAFSIYEPDTPVLRGAIQEPNPREPIGLSGGRLAEAFDELIQDENTAELMMEEFSRAVPWFGGFGVMKVKEADNEDAPTIHGLAFWDRFFRKDSKHHRLLSANDINEGVLYVAFILILCLHKNVPSFFAVENWDHGLNPRLVKVLMQSISKYLLDDANRQVILTTHSPMALDGLPLQDERVRLFTMGRSDAGKSVVRRVKIDAKLIEMANKGWTLSRLWVMGHLGGVPNV